MPNLSQVLRQEITRIARKELRGEIQVLKSTAAKHRSEIAALKRQVADLKHGLTESSRAARKSARITAAATNDVSKLRYSAKNLAALRRRLDLSAEHFGTVLLGVSGQTIYNWEADKGRPNKEHMGRIAAARALSKRDAHAIVAAATAAT